MPGSSPECDPDLREDLRGGVCLPPDTTFASFQLISPAEVERNGVSAAVVLAVFELLGPFDAALP